MPRVIEFAKQNFRGSISNPRQLLTVFLSESEDETVKDFIVNRNPEFAYQIVQCSKTEEKQ